MHRADPQMRIQCETLCRAAIRASTSSACRCSNVSAAAAESACFTKRTGRRLAVAV